MPIEPSKDRCVGRCNAKARKALRAYADAVTAHKAALANWEHARIQADGDARLLAELDRIRPQPPAEPDITWTRGTPVWCSRDAAAIRAALADLDDLAALLESWSDGHRGAASGERTSGGQYGSRSPNPIADTLEEMYGELATVEANWREHRGLPPRPRRSTTEARSRTVAWLLAQLDGILAHPGSVEFGHAAIAWQARLQKLAKSDPVVRRRPVPCPRCDRRALRTRDDGYTQCAACGRLLDEDEYGDLAEAAEVKLAVEEARAS